MSIFDVTRHFKPEFNTSLDSLRADYSRDCNKHFLDGKMMSGLELKSEQEWDGPQLQQQLLSYIQTHLLSHIRDQALQVKISAQVMRVLMSQDGFLCDLTQAVTESLHQDENSTNSLSYSSFLINFIPSAQGLEVEIRMDFNCYVKEKDGSPIRFLPKQGQAQIAMACARFSITADDYAGVQVRPDFVVLKTSDAHLKSDLATNPHWRFDELLDFFRKLFGCEPLHHIKAETLRLLVVDNLPHDCV